MKPFLAKLKINAKRLTHRLIIPLEGVGKPYLGKDFNILYRDDRLVVDSLDLFSKLGEADLYEDSDYIITEEQKRDTIIEIFKLGPYLLGKI